MKYGLPKRLVIASVLTVVITQMSVLPGSVFAENPAARFLNASSGRSFYPDLIADVAEAVAPSVVNIDVQRTEAVQMPDMNDFFGGQIFQRFFGGDPGLGGDGSGSPFFQFKTQPAQPGGGVQERVLSGNGSGMVFDKVGHILTNNHVVSGADTITITFQDGRKASAQVVGRDAYTDLAVLKLDTHMSDLKPIKSATQMSKLRPGEWVLAVGSPLGFDHTVTVGIISALSRRVPDLNSNVAFIQTDAAINPGNSGGPLVSLSGEVVGINTAISGRGQNIGFAIPMDVASEVASALIADGKITRPWIGISMTELNPTLAKSLGLQDGTAGVVVAGVMRNGPAAKAGFRQGDVIQRVDGKTVDKATAIQQLVKDKPLKTTFNFQILRNGQMLALPVTTDQLPDKDLSRMP